MKQNVINSSMLFAIVTMLLGSLARSTEAQESRAYLHSFNLPAHGVAIEGYSPVSYFTAGKATLGSKEFAVNHNGVTYYLVSDQEKSEFNKNPERYVPAYGGWCAFGMAVEDKFPVDPANFKIVDGRLNLFLKNKDIDARVLWEKGTEKDLIKKAAKHWKKIRG